MMEKDYLITCFYYDDIQAVAPFYEDVLGFEFVLIRAWHVSTGLPKTVISGLLMAIEDTASSKNKVPSC